MLEEIASCIPPRWCEYELFADAGSPVYKDEPIYGNSVY